MDLYYEEYVVDDIDAAFVGAAGWDFDYLQLSSGPLGLHWRSVECGELRIDWSTYGQSVHHVDANNTDQWVFSFLLEAKVPPVFEGREQRPGAGIFFAKGRQNDYVVHAGTTSLTLHLRPELLPGLQIRTDPHPIIAVAPEELVELANLCRQVTASAAGAGGDHDRRRAVKNRVIETLARIVTRRVVQTEENESRSRVNPHRTVRQALQVMLEMGPFNKVDIPSLAERLGVSQRTLYAHFRSCLGVGPYQYDLTRRMHLFRDQLIAGPAFKGKVTEAAIDAGFDHLSRLTQNFRRHFGETPREAMKRWTIERRQALRNGSQHAPAGIRSSQNEGANAVPCGLDAESRSAKS